MVTFELRRIFHRILVKIEISELTAFGNVLMYDHIGFGFSDKPKKSFILDGETHFLDRHWLLILLSIILYFQPSEMELV